MTWAVPVGVFFTSIIGWQYFVGYRSVPPGKCYVHDTPNPPKGEEGKCYVQYMDEALFNCLLQVGYFWIILNAVIALPRTTVPRDAGAQGRGGVTLRLLNCLLQVGYFWIILSAVIALPRTTVPRDVGAQGRGE